MKILVIKPSSLGDVVHALPFLQAVKSSFAGAHVDWVLSRNFEGLLKGNPLIENLILLNKDSWKKIRKIPETVAELTTLRKKLKSKHYDMVIDLQGLLRSGLIAFSTDSTLTVGFARAREGSKFFYDKKVTVPENLHAVDKCLAVAEAIGAKAGKAEFPLHVDREAEKRVKELLSGVTDYVVIIPSARWSSKRWPADNFAALISKINKPCVIAGSRGDNRIAKKILHSLANKPAFRPDSSSEQGAIKKKNKTVSNKNINLCGKTELKDLVALLSGASAVVSNDTGPMHIAAALGKPVVAIFGPTDPIKTGPYGWQTDTKLSVLQSSTPCRPCRKRDCTDLACMKNISINSVYKALEVHL